MSPSVGTVVSMSASSFIIVPVDDTELPGGDTAAIPF